MSELLSHASGRVPCLLAAHRATGRPSSCAPLQVPGGPLNDLGNAICRQHMPAVKEHQFLRGRTEPARSAPLHPLPPSSHAEPSAPPTPEASLSWPDPVWYLNPAREPIELLAEENPLGPCRLQNHLGQRLEVRTRPWYLMTRIGRYLQFCIIAGAPQGLIVRLSSLKLRCVQLFLE